MASVVSGSTGSLVSSGSSAGTNEDCVINEDHFSSSCSSLELEDIQEAIEGVGSCLKASNFSAQNIPWDLRGLASMDQSEHPSRCDEPFLRPRSGRMQGRNLSIAL